MRQRGVCPSKQPPYILITETEKGLKLLYNVKGLFVDIFSDLFPACNIQIYESLTPKYYAEHDCWYGFYWEMMFDSGEIIEVSQDRAVWHNDPSPFRDIPGFEDATILIWDGFDDYVLGGPNHGIQTHSLEELRDELKKQIEIINTVKEPV